MECISLYEGHLHTIEIILIIVGAGIGTLGLFTVYFLNTAQKQMINAFMEGEKAQEMIKKEAENFLKTLNIIDKVTKRVKKDINDDDIPF